MRNLHIVLEYDGTGFSGWQAQPDRRTVQGVVEDAVEKVTGVHSRVHGAGRTDAGVHAEGQSANFRTESMIPVKGFAGALTAALPDDVAVHHARDVPGDFHARHSAIGRVYRYRIVRAGVRRPLRRLRAWHVREALDVDAMRAGASQLIGERDFRSFAAELEPHEATMRVLRRADVETLGDEMSLEFEASAFLRRMVRLVVGTLVEVGRGRWPAARVREVLAARDVRASGPSAPAHGLCLVRVLYADAPGAAADARNGS